MNIKVFALGLKGHAVVEVLLSRLLPEDRIFVVIGRDPNVLEDYSEVIRELCILNNVGFAVSNSHYADNKEYDIFIAAGWRWMIHGVPEERLIIFHDSILPRYRGFAPLVNCLLNREREIGVTALFGGEKFDTGHILAQEKIFVSYPTNISREIERVSKLYGVLAWRVYSDLHRQKGLLSGVPQDDSLATYSLWRDEEDYRIDWSLSSEEIEHFISCVGFPYLGASSIVDNELIRVLDATVVPDVNIENRVPGKVLFIDDGSPIVVCGRGLLRLNKIIRSDGEEVAEWKKIRVRFR